MTTGTTQDATKLNLPEGTEAIITQGNLSVTFSGAGKLTVNGKVYSINETGLVLPANDQQGGNIVQRVLYVGQRLRDGTVVLSVDLDKNEALFVPGEIFGGRARLGSQHNLVASVNKEALHGHNDWRLLDVSKWDTPDDEGRTLADNWAKVTTKNPEWFWLASSLDDEDGRVRCGGNLNWRSSYRVYTLPVPVVRSGPARILDI